LRAHEEAFMTASFRDRIGIDILQKLSLEPAIDWAAANGVRYIDVCIDPDQELLRDGSDRARAARRKLEDQGIVLGLHTLSGVNIAEFSPYVSEGADAYLDAYIRAAEHLGARWIVVHAGYHFSDDKEKRMRAALARLERASREAERRGVTLLLENLNPEPEQAEVQYLAHDVEECVYFFSRLDSPALRWSFTVNHAHLTPEGIDGFLDSLDIGRCGEVRIADCRGTVEEHLYPGKGTIDFPAMFARIEGLGYRGPYIQAFGTLDDMLAGRDTLTAMARKRVA
jgi:sugar phosphate isomerase/epimerase